jgi:toxin FitB
MRSWTRRVRFLIDSNVFREIGKTDRDPNVAAWLDTVDDAGLAISALTVREVRKGILKLRAKKHDIADQIEERVRGIFDAFGERILPVTREI